MIDRLWEAGEYQTWLETRVTKPTVGVHRALVRWTDGEIRDSHLKIVFDAGDKPCRHLVHEAVSWLLSRELGLPSPPFGGIMILSADQVARAHPDRPVAGDTVAWVTSTEPVRTLVLTDRMEGDAQLTKELSQWKAVQAACAFDEWLGNVDRHPRNLLRKGQNDFVLIDHDFIAGGPNWLSDILSASHFDDFANVLRDRCALAKPGDPTAERKFSNAMLEHSAAYPAAMGAQRDSIKDWIFRLMDDETDRQALENFIAARAEAAQNLIRRRYRLLM